MMEEEMCVLLFFYSLMVREAPFIKIFDQRPKGRERMIHGNIHENSFRAEGTVELTWHNHGMKMSLMYVKYIEYRGEDRIRD